MGKTRIEVSTKNPHCVADLTLQCENALICVSQMRHPEVGEWLSGHLGLFTGNDLTTFRSFDFEAPSQDLQTRIVARALGGLDFKRAA